MSENKWEALSHATGRVSYRLTNDYLFRAVLQKNKKVLKGLIGALLHLEPKEIQSIEIINPIILGERIDEKTFILDIRILLNDSTVINIEMQVTDNQDWVERSLVYLCRAFDQTVKGGNYADIRETIHISILDYTLFPNQPEFYAKYQMLNLKNHHVYSDKFKLYVLDLTHAELAMEEDRRNSLYQWAKLFKAGTWEEIKVLAKENEYIEEAAVTMYDVSAEENIRLQCEARKRYEEDRATLVASGIRQGKDQYAKLSKALLAEKRYTDLEKAADDENYREKLFREYGF